MTTKPTQPAEAAVNTGVLGTILEANATGWLSSQESFARYVAGQVIAQLAAKGTPAQEAAELASHYANAAIARFS
jgi:hypothetical protein